MTDLVTLMGRKDIMFKISMKMKFGEDEDSDEELNEENYVRGSVSDYTLNASALRRKQTHRYGN